VSGSPAPAAGEPVLAIVGPTGVGKTAVAVALAAHRAVEVIGVDSRQVYRGLDVGTGKPSPAERAAVSHHLLDVADPDETYDAARFVRDATAAIDAVRARGRVPLLVGGTGLYYRALTRGLRPRPPADPALRARLAALARAEGPEALHRRLAAVDPAAAARLHPRDAVRVTRALEVAPVAGPAAGAARRPAGPAGDAGPGGWRGAAPRMAVTAFGLTMDRAALHRRLDARVDRMVAGGLVEEIRGLLASGLAADRPAMQGIGYRHLAPVVGGTARLADAVLAMKRDTRRYAKRQWTWFAREEGITWLDVTGLAPAEAAARIDKSIERLDPFD
jgi:tRNA dimethylallyltransferase